MIMEVDAVVARLISIHGHIQVADGNSFVGDEPSLTNLARDAFVCSSDFSDGFEGSLAGKDVEKSAIKKLWKP